MLYSCFIPDWEGPVEGELNHVVNPDIRVNLRNKLSLKTMSKVCPHLVIRVVVPAVPNVPEPRFSPQALEPVDQDQCVEKPPFSISQVSNRPRNGCGHVYWERHFCNRFISLFDNNLALWRHKSPFLRDPVNVWTKCQCWCVPQLLTTL